MAIKPTPDDPRYDPAVVTEFSSYMRGQSFSIPVPAAAREPYTGDMSSNSSELYSWPGTDALNRAYSKVMDAIYTGFHRTDSAGKTFSAQDPDNPLSHSVVIQDSVGCVGHP